MRIPRDWFGPPDDLVPFGPRVADGESRRREPPSPARVEAGAGMDPNSFWDEASSSIQGVVDANRDGDTQELVGAMSTGQPSTAGNRASWGRRPAELREWLLRPRFMAGIVAATALAFACAGALGLVEAHRASKKSSSVSHGVGRAAQQSGEYASVASTGSLDARMVERPHVRRSVSVSHPERSARKTHRSVSPVVPSSYPQGEPVSYHKASPANQVATRSGGSASYQTAATAPSPPQGSSAATASASDRSNSSAPQPPHPSPTGALTCISNCG